MCAILIMSTLAVGAIGPHRSVSVGRWLNFRGWRLWRAWMKFVALEIISDWESIGQRRVDGNGRASSTCVNTGSNHGATNGSITNAGDSHGNSRGFDLKNDQAIFAIVPHGIFPFALGFATLPEAVVNAIGTIQPVVASATGIVPFLKTVIDWIGGIDASRTAVDHALSSGSRIGVAPGGIAEMFEGYPKPGTDPDGEYTLLRNRTGFVRMAIKHRLPIVPVYCFGSSKFFHRVQLPEFVEKISNLLRISICPFFGPWGLPVPYRTRLLYAVGRPIFPPSSMMQGIEGVGREGDDVVEHVHGQVRTELYRIFEKYKFYYGWDRKSLEIV